MKFSQRKEIGKKSTCDAFVPEFMRTTRDKRRFNNERKSEKYVV